MMTPYKVTHITEGSFVIKAESKADAKVSVLEKTGWLFSDIKAVEELSPIQYEAYYTGMRNDRI
jgi:hypothetical protein